MYYLKDGLGSYKGCKQIGAVLAVLFSAFCLLASFGIGNMSQVNSIAANMTSAFSIPATVTGIVLGDHRCAGHCRRIKRIAARHRKAGSFHGDCLCHRCFGNLLRISVTWVLCSPLFSKEHSVSRAVGGGIVGSGVKLALTWGMKCGVFSNEAGLGSSVMVHSSSNVKEPVRQGMGHLRGIR